LSFHLFFFLILIFILFMGLYLFWILFIIFFFLITSLIILFYFYIKYNSNSFKFYFFFIIKLGRRVKWNILYKLQNRIFLNYEKKRKSGSQLAWKSWLMDWMLDHVNLSELNCMVTYWRLSLAKTKHLPTWRLAFQALHASQSTKLHQIRGSVIMIVI
jgi:hypothetical protein